MKRSFAVNINGRIYNIDEDAYTLLNEYLDQLRSTFASDDEREIVDDIEARISEHFTDTVDSSGIITINDVKKVIEIMGRPEQLSGTNDERESISTSSHTQSVPPPFNSEQYAINETTANKKLYRSLDEKVIGGVLSGIATYFEWNVILLRLLVVAVTLIPWISGGIIILAYIVCWIVIPPANTPRRRLELEGQPITPDAIGRKLTDQAQDNILDARDKRNGLDIVGDIFNVIIKGMVAFVSFTAGCIGFGTLVAALVCFITAIGVGATSAEFINETFNTGINLQNPNPGLTLSAAGTICMAIALPASLITWGGCCLIFASKTPSKATIITFIALEILIIVTAIILFAVIAPIHPQYLCINYHA